MGGVELAGRPDLTAVLIGDFCDNGPEIPELLAFLCDVMSKDGKYGEIWLHPILGNHDLANLLAAKPGIFGSPNAGSAWWKKWQNFWNGWKSGTPGGYGVRAGGSLA